MSIESINPKDYDAVSTKLTQFFKNKGFCETYEQNRLTILAACEDVDSIATFQYAGELWPHIQSNQMKLEGRILNDPNCVGFFCYTTSYREEKNPLKGRHNLIFPMFEFEFCGTVDDLIQLMQELLVWLGFSTSTFHECRYLDVCKKYGINEIGHQEEQMLWKDFGEVVFLRDFPESTNPFFNMARSDGLAKKVDVILYGIETFGSAERSCDPDEMREKFHTISNGQYSQTLFDKFGKDRVIAELDEFLSLKFVPRVGCGIGITRLIRAMKLHNII